MGGAPRNYVDSLPTGEVKPLWPSPVEVARLREAAMTTKLRARKSQRELEEEHAAAAKKTDVIAHEKLEAELNKMRNDHVHELNAHGREYATSIGKLHQELQQVLVAPGSPVANVESRLRRDVCAKLWRLDEEQRRYQASEAITHEDTLQSVIAQAEEAERAYQRLREALMLAHVEAEKLHTQTMAEQAEQVKELSELEQA